MNMTKKDINDLRYPDKVIIPYLKFDFLNTAIIAATEDMKIQFKKFKNNLPIYFYNTGDEVFLYDSMNSDNPTNSIESAQQVPRMVLSLGNISVDSQQLSNPHVRGEFIFNANGRDSVFSSSIRRIPLNFKVNCVVTVSNVIEQLRFIELIMLILYRTPTFNFQYLSKTNYGSYSISDDFETERNLELGFDSTSRRPTVGFNVDIDLQYPAIDYYGSTFLSEYGGIIKNPITNVNPIPNIPNNDYDEPGSKNPNDPHYKDPKIPNKTGDTEQIAHENIPDSKTPGNLKSGTFQGPTMNSFDNIPRTHADDSDLELI